MLLASTAPVGWCSAKGSMLKYKLKLSNYVTDSTFLFLSDVFLIKNSLSVDVNQVSWFLFLLTEK